MPKVVISGYYGFHNSGDEAILFAMSQALRKKIPNLEITVLSKAPEYTRQEFQVSAVSRDNPWDVYRAIKKANLLISGGGGLLQDVTSPRSIVYYLGVIVIALMTGTPVFCYAQGIGPVRTGFGRKAVRRVMNRVNEITVRDEDSKQELLAMGVRQPEILVTADPVLGLDLSTVDRQLGKDILSSLGVGDGPLAGISVISWKGSSNYNEVIAKAADDLMAAGWQVLLVPMHNPVDIKPCREVAALMKAKPVILDAGTYYKELLAIAANLDLAVGMRLHFLIFCALFGVPLIGISYDPKVDRFLQLIGQTPDLFVNDLDYYQLSQRIKYVLDNRDNISTGIGKKVDCLREQALINVTRVAELL
ncbi:MAG: polysaccharide pyruvyl transferase CsaB [Peptococcaceae bacterium]|nr:polysaccharide pyruvyl transferase CsaB [Peptococcaceae bacterium]